MCNRTERDLEQQSLSMLHVVKPTSILIDMKRHDILETAICVWIWCFVNDYDLTSHSSKQVQNGIICNTFWWNVSTYPLCIVRRIWYFYNELVPNWSGTGIREQDGIILICISASVSNNASHVTAQHEADNTPVMLPVFDDWSSNTSRCCRFESWAGYRISDWNFSLLSPHSSIQEQRFWNRALPIPAQ
jgi:hypothetical protein